VPGLVLPTVRVAAVRAAPVFADPAATLEKVDALVAQAAGRGAGLASSGTAFMPGFPVWNGVPAPAGRSRCRP
jgi:nitrilase